MPQDQDNLNIVKKFAGYVSGILAATILLRVLQVLICIGQINFPQWYLPTPDETTEKIPIFLGFLALASIIYLPLFIANIVYFLRWQYRTQIILKEKNGDEAGFSPVAGIVWWFVPLANLVLPVFVFREIWKLTVSKQKNDEEPSYIGFWWATWILSNVGAQILDLKQGGNIEEMDSNYFTMLIVVLVLNMISAWLLIPIIKRITNSLEEISAPYLSNIHQSEQ